MARYRGLTHGPVRRSAWLLVKPGVAKRQIDAEVASLSPVPGAGSMSVPAHEAGVGSGPGTAMTSPAVALKPPLCRYHGSVRLDPARDASRIAGEVIAHIAGQVGTAVTVTLEIEASLPDGATEQMVRAVTENSRTLKFTSYGFEED